MPASVPTWTLKLLYDGLCPLCSREVSMLRKRNGRGLLAFQDIADPAFEPATYNITMADAIGAMHAVRPDGSIVRGIDVFAEVYEVVGWHWLARPLRWRLTRPIAKLAYRIFAAVRPKLSKLSSDGCAAARCKIPQG